MTDEHTPDEQVPDEPTQPLAGWRPSEPATGSDAGPAPEHDGADHSSADASSGVPDDSSADSAGEPERPVQPEGHPYGCADG